MAPAFIATHTGIAASAKAISQLAPNFNKYARRALRASHSYAIPKPRQLLGVVKHRPWCLSSARQPHLI